MKKILKQKTGLIGQANGSKVVRLSADLNAGPFKGQFPLVSWIFTYVLFTYLFIYLLFNIKRKKHKRKESSIRSINPLKLIKRV